MKFKSLMVAVALAVMGVLGVALPEKAMAVKCPEGSVRAGQDVGSYAECNLSSESSSTDLMDTIMAVINVVLGVVGLAAVIMIVIGGISFVTSQGDAAKVTRARNTVLYGVVGLVIALLAFAIVNFVLSGVFGTKS